MAKYLAKIIILSAQAMGRAFVKTCRQEIEAFHEAARIHRASSSTANSNGNDMLVKGMTLSEARQILNVADLGDQKAIDTHYQHLFRANEKPAGGSFYLQSKVYRAKERIDQELAKLQAAAAAAAAAAASTSTPDQFSSPSVSSSASASSSQSPTEAQSQAKKPDQESR